MAKCKGPRMRNSRGRNSRRILENLRDKQGTSGQQPMILGSLTVSVAATCWPTTSTPSGIDRHPSITGAHLADTVNKQQHTIQYFPLEFQCYIAAKQTICSSEIDIQGLTASSLACIDMILIAAQVETTKGDMSPHLSHPFMTFLVL